MSNVKQRLSDQFIQGWDERLNISSKASLYKHISSFKFKPYLDICNIPKFRYSLTRLRVSSHMLNIECGRWARPNIIPVNERKCQNCNVLEDENHFVLECSLYNELRKQYIPSFNRKNPSMQKCIQLLSIETPSLLRKLSCVKWVSLSLTISVRLVFFCFLQTNNHKYTHYILITIYSYY